MKKKEEQSRRIKWEKNDLREMGLVLLYCFYKWRNKRKEEVFERGVSMGIFGSLVELKPSLTKYAVLEEEEMRVADHYFILAGYCSNLSCLWHIMLFLYHYVMFVALLLNDS